MDKLRARIKALGTYPNTLDPLGVCILELLVACAMAIELGVNEDAIEDEFTPSREMIRQLRAEGITEENAGQWIEARIALAERKHVPRNG